MLFTVGLLSSTIQSCGENGCVIISKRDRSHQRSEAMHNEFLLPHLFDYRLPYTSTCVCTRKIYLEPALKPLDRKAVLKPLDRQAIGLVLKPQDAILRNTRKIWLQMGYS